MIWLAVSGGNIIIAINCFILGEALSIIMISYWKGGRILTPVKRLSVKLMPGRTQSRKKFVTSTSDTGA
jgi:hypothetical protein